ncbi:sulfurtransferase TusA family protein [Leeia sp. TBRC 13508]|uniref:Sulfurtransferase TusA family protein n=2 Tax=Leeia speluncae TaxID=2884804 RepID=A0ABS8D6L1_9NEIS|nr:sulfurtransferase TusA family protein [Leeia speluncae]MCB6183850.1 sulfurtransferase TusA family protein [Leeia speluncae]
MNPDLEIDLKGLNCPLPILRTKKTLATLDSGKLLQVLATDPGTPTDFAQFCQQTGHELISTEQVDNYWKFLIRRK